MRIEIIGGSSSGTSTITGLHTDFDSLLTETDSVIEALNKLRSFSYNMSGGIGILQNAVGNVEGRLQAEENKKNAISSAKDKCRSFLQLVSTIDMQVADCVDRNKDDFYKVNQWASTSALTSMMDSWYQSAKKWLRDSAQAVVDKIDHSFRVYTETDFSSLTLEELKTYYDDILKKLENGELSPDDLIRLKSLLNFLSGVELNPSMSDAEKTQINMYINLYEAIEANAKDKEAISDFFRNSAYDEKGNLKEGISEDDIVNIKYIAYRSKSPCHEVFFDNISKCQVVSWNYNGTSHYDFKDSNRGVYLNFRSGDGIDNPRGAYNTFFHEIGHNIDDLLVGGYDYDANASYVGIYTTDEVASGRFYDVIYEDVEQNFKNAISSYSNDEAMIGIDSTGQAKILDVLMGRANRDSLNPRLDFAYRKIYEDYTGIWKGVFSGKNYRGSETGSLQGVEREQVSDITGGITNNATSGVSNGGYGHTSNGYWYIGKDSGDIIGNGSSATDLQQMEFFAEYFAYEMTGDPDEAYARSYFPNAYRVIDEAMKQQATKIKANV